MTLNKKLIVYFSGLLLVILAIIIPLVNLNSELKTVTKSVDLAARNLMIAERINASAMFIKSSRNELDEKTAREDLKHQINLLRKSLLVLSDGGDAPEMPMQIEINPAESTERYVINTTLDLVTELDKQIYTPLLNEQKNVQLKVTRKLSTGKDAQSFSVDTLIDNPTFNEAFLALIQNYNQRSLVNACIKLRDTFAAKYDRVSLEFNNYLYFTIIAILVCVVIVSLLILRAVNKPLSLISTVAQEMSNGNVSSRINYKANDEIGAIANHINNLSQTIQSTASFISAIGNGDFDARYDVEVNTTINEKNNLPLATLNMRDKLKQVAEEETKRNWVTSGLAKLGEINRAIDSADEKMYDTYLQFLVKYMNANQGGLFIINDDDAFNPKFNLVSCVAYERKKFIEKEIPLTEGLIGQCYLENDIIYITELPDTHLKITSGLGDSMPKCLILLPLKTNDKTIGVIELASFEVLDNFKLEFLKKACESIATLIVGLKANIKTNKLLLQTQQQTEEMRAQEEEMRQNMEELMATQEEMDRSRKEVETKEAYLTALIDNTSDSIMEMDLDYKVVVINQTLLKRYKGTRYEAIQVGVNPLELFDEDLRKEWKDYYDRAFAGEQFKFVIKSVVGTEASNREYSVNPVRNKEGKIIGVSVFSRDVNIA